MTKFEPFNCPYCNGDSVIVHGTGSMCMDCGRYIRGMENNCMRIHRGNRGRYNGN